jgi:hypothetical protein
MGMTEKQFQPNERQGAGLFAPWERDVYRTETRKKYPSLRRSETLFNELENVLVLERDVKLSEQSQILVPKRSAAMVLFLVLDVANDSIKLRMPVREGAIAFLPTELPANPLVLVYMIR